VRQLTGDYPGAAEALEAALGISRDLGDRLGRGNALSNLGVVRQLTGDLRGAAEALEAALGIFRGLGDRLGEGYVLHELGAVRRLTRDYPGAAEAQEAALGILRDLGDRLGQGNALGELGVVRRLTGDYPGASEALEAALGISRDLSDRLGAAEALNEALLSAHPATDSSADIQALYGLPGNVSDDFEVLVQVQNREPGKLRRRRDDQVGNGRRTVLPAVRQQGQHFNRAVLDRRSQVLHGHRR
jgi:tetratricopeptide (TPR) repeat protein